MHVAMTPLNREPIKLPEDFFTGALRAGRFVLLAAGFSEVATFLSQNTYGMGTLDFTFLSARFPS